MIGLSTAVQYLVILAAAPFVPRLMARQGPVPVMACSIAATVFTPDMRVFQVATDLRSARATRSGSILSGSLGGKPSSMTPGRTTSRLLSGMVRVP